MQAVSHTRVRSKLEHVVPRGLSAGYSATTHDSYKRFIRLGRHSFLLACLGVLSRQIHFARARRLRAGK